MVRTGGHVLWLSQSSDTLFSDPAKVSSLEAFGFCATFESCSVGTPWCLQVQLFSTWQGVLDLSSVCGGRCDRVSLSSRSPCGLLWSELATQLWPAIADALATAFYGIMGSTVTPKCTHLAGVLAPTPGTSMLNCLQWKRTGAMQRRRSSNTRQM